MRTSIHRSLRARHVRWHGSRSLVVALLPGLLLGLLLLLLSACQVPDPFIARSSGARLSGATPVISATEVARGGHSGAIPAGWKIFTDEFYGFRLAYPPTWMLVPGDGGSHITLVTATGTTLSPIVTVEQVSPAAALAQNTPSSSEITLEHMTVTQTQVAGHPAVDIFSPYIPSTFQAPNSGRALAASQAIVVAVLNDAGTTNVYTFLSYFQVDKQGHMSAAALADQQMVTQIVATFQFPAKIDPALS